MRPLLASVAALLSLCLEACGGEAVVEERSRSAPSFTSEAIIATVVDAEGGQPVEGAVILAVWRKIDPDVGRWDESLFGVAETVTDASGRFEISRWGPRYPPRDTILDARGPELWVLKSGYLVGFFDERGAQTAKISLDDIRSDSPLHYLTLPPNKTPDGGRENRRRAAEGSSRWSGQNLQLSKPADPAELAGSLAVANPFVNDLARKLSPTPLYWGEWERSRDSLPAELRNRVPFPPMTLVDYVISARVR